MWGRGPTGTILCGFTYTTRKPRTSGTSARKVAYDGVRPEIVSLDVVKVRGVLKRRDLPVQLFHPPNPQIRVDMGSNAKPANLLMFGYPWRISRMLHLKCLT